jgi:transcription antitermination factor NusG
MFGRVAVYERLRDGGWDCYRPLCKVRTRQHGRPVYVERPVLGRYVFVRMMMLGPTDDWPHQFHRIKAVAGRGLYGILMSQEKPCIVRHYEIQMLRDKGFVATSRTSSRRVFNHSRK